MRSRFRATRASATTIVRRQLTFRRGDLFRQSKLLESQRRLYWLEVFEFANVQPVRAEGEQPTEIPTRVTVTEGKHRKVKFGVGYGTEERARAEVDWRHVNFFGGARTADVLARYSRLDGGVRLNLTQPYFFSRNYSLGLQGQYWHTEEPAYDLTPPAAASTVARQFGARARGLLGGRPTMTVSLTYANEWRTTRSRGGARRSDQPGRAHRPRPGSGDRGGQGRRSALSFDAGRSTTDNMLDAKRGYLASLHLEKAGNFLSGDFNYYEIYRRRPLLPVTSPTARSSPFADVLVR